MGNDGVKVGCIGDKPTSRCSGCSLSSVLWSPSSVKRPLSALRLMVEFQWFFMALSVLRTVGQDVSCAFSTWDVQTIKKLPPQSDASSARVYWTLVQCSKPVAMTTFQLATKHLTLIHTSQEAVWQFRPSGFPAACGLCR